MKVFLSLALLVSFSALAQNNGDFMKDTKEALAIAKNCAKSRANIELSSGFTSISSSPIETLGGEEINAVNSIDTAVDERVDVIYQKTNSAEVIVLDVKISRGNTHWSLGGASHRGQSGCEQYRQ